MSLLFSIVESPLHPNFSDLYRSMGLQEVRLASMRKAMAELKKQRPDFIVAEFFYGYGNNYAGVNISNLDVFMRSLQRYAPEARVIVLVDKSERQYVDKLNEMFPLHGVLIQPASVTQMESLLSS
jgi:hypothetical protein